MRKACYKSRNKGGNGYYHSWCHAVNRQPFNANQSDTTGGAVANM